MRMKRNMNNLWFRGRLIEGSKSMKFYLDYEIQSSRHRGMQLLLCLHWLNQILSATLNRHNCFDRSCEKYD